VGIRRQIMSMIEVCDFCGKPLDEKDKMHGRKFLYARPYRSKIKKLSDMDVATMCVECYGRLLKAIRGDGNETDR
jgi:hypothetical protein